jgi:hypothetical protein
VVCTQSRPLAAAIDGNFRVSGQVYLIEVTDVFQKESSTGEIDLEEDDPHVIGFMLEYFYKGDLSIEANIGTSENPIDLESTPQLPAPPPLLPPSVQVSLMETRMFPRQYPGGPLLSQGQMNNPVNPAINLINNSINGSAASLPFGYQPIGQSIQRSYAIIPQPSFGPSGFTHPFVDTLPPPPITPPVDPQNLVTLAAIYVVAEKYDVQPLKVLAKIKYESILPTAWNTKHFVESLELIYDGLPEMTEPDSLRDLAIKTAAAHAKELMNREEFMDLCKERGDFATDVFKASLQQNQTSAADTAGAGPSGLPRCRNDSGHMIYGLGASRTYGGPMMQRYKCAVCNAFVD